MSSKNITIAIDGTAASGKGTLARSLSKEFNFAYLDTGEPVIEHSSSNN